MSRPTTVGYEVDDGVPATIRIVPADPVPETNADGVPAAMLCVSGRTGMLTIGVRWWPSEPELVAIRERVAATMERAQADFAISPDALLVMAVSLVLTPGGERIELARAASSGTPPYTTLFTADVSEHLDVVQRACLGEPGLLQVQVEAELTRGRTATTVLAADLGPWADELPGSDDAALTDRIDKLVADGLVQRTRSAAPGSGPSGPDKEETELAAEADRLAAQRFVAVVGGAGTPGESAVVTAAATAHSLRHVPLVRTADVGQWLRGSPSRHVLVAGPGPVEESHDEPGPQVPITLDFPAADAPLDRVEVTAGGSTAVLAAPFDDPVTVPDSDSLAVTTRYKGGGPTFSVTVSKAGGPWRLSPADLGLTQVTVDATNLHEAGATGVDADVFYQPEDRGSPDRRTVQLGSDGWKASWFVVSRGPGLAGQLLVSLLVTPGDVPGVQPSVRSTTATVLL